MAANHGAQVVDGAGGAVIEIDDILAFPVAESPHTLLETLQSAGVHGRELDDADPARLTDRFRWRQRQPKTCPSPGGEKEEGYPGFAGHLLILRTLSPSCYHQVSSWTPAFQPLVSPPKMGPPTCPRNASDHPARVT